MPSPSTTATARPDLGASFMEMSTDMMLQGFIGPRIFPIFNTPKQSGTFKRVTLESLLRTIDTRRASGGAYNRSKWEFDDDGYNCRPYGEEEPIDDRDAENYEDYFDAELIGSARARAAVMRGHEERVAAKLNGTANETAAGTTWSTHDSADPVANVEAAVLEARARGVMANTLVVEWEGFRNLRLCQAVTDKLHSQGAGRSIEPGQITPAILASVFDLDNVIVAGGLQNTADEGQAATISSIWGRTKAYVCRVAPQGNIDLAEPCVGRTFSWSGAGGSGTFDSYREEQTTSEIIRYRFEADEKELFPEAVEAITGVLS